MVGVQSQYFGWSNPAPVVAPLSARQQQQEQHVVMESKHAFVWQKEHRERMGATAAHRSQNKNTSKNKSKNKKHKQAIRQTTKQTICIEDAPLPPFDHFPPSPQPLQIATTTTTTTSTNTKGASGQLVRRNRDRSSFFAEKSTMRIRDEESQKAKQEQIENYELRTENRERKNKKGRTEKS